MTLSFSGNTFPELYERSLVGPLFRPWAEALLDDAGLAAGERLLDVACGTGIVARLARQRLGIGARVVGIDVSAQMLAVARALAPDIDWREGSASALPLRDAERFDVVCCQQGLQFFPDRAAALREMHRALCPGGRVAISTWRCDAEIPLLRELHGVAERQLGAVVDARHGLGDAGALQALLRDAGFRDVRCATQARTIRFDHGAVFVRMNANALFAMSAHAKADADERARIIDAIVQGSADAVAPYTGARGLAFDIASNVATATR